MSVPAGIWARFEVYFSGAQKNWSNILWYTGAGTFSGSYDQDAFAAAFVAAMATSLTTPMSTDFNFIGCYCLVSNGTGRFGVKHYVDIPGADGTADPLPEDVSIVVQRISDQPGKSGRGRIYFSGWTGSAATGSYLNSTGRGYGTALQTALKAPITDQGLTWSPAVHSQKTNSLHAMVNCLTVSLLGTSRRRRASF